MPNIGGKIWFTAIAGLLLGFVLFGMLQRGCDAQGGSAVVTTDDRPEPIARDFSATRNNARTYEPQANSSRNTNARFNSSRRNGRDRIKNGRTTRSSGRNATSNRRTAIERSAAARSRADAARKAELARLTRERTQQYRERARRFSADDPNVIDPAIRASTTGAGLENTVAQAAAQAGDELRAQRGEGGSGSSGSGGSDVGGSGGGGGDGSGGGDGEGGANDEFGEFADLLADLGIDQSFIDLIQQVVTGTTPPVNPFDPGNGNDDDDDDFDEIDGPVIPIDPDDVIDLTTPVIARWAPIDNSSCGSANTQGLVTRDLYIAFLEQPLGPPVLSSKGENTLTIQDGVFYQESLGTNGPPSLSENNCTQFDSYLTIGKADPIFLSAPDPADWGSELLAEWFVLGGAQITQDADAFGDDRWYVHVGRFTANENAKVFGKLRVDFTGLPAIVEVPDWQGAELDDTTDDTPELPEVASVSTPSAGVLGGSTIQGAGAIDIPAPVGGTIVSLATNRPDRVLLPSSVLIPEGQQSATFEIQTIATGVVETATITALTDTSQRSVMLQLEAPSILSFEALNTDLRDGQRTSAVIRLNHPADEGGTTISLSVNQEDSVIIPATVRIPAGQFRTVFQIEAANVNEATSVAIRATVGGESRDIVIQITPTITIVDTNMDGRIDTADLGMLIGSFGSNNPRFDFNGDGVVDTADLGMLTGRFGDEYEPGETGGGDNPGSGEEDAVISRWVDVSFDGECEIFNGNRSADLYLGFKEIPSTPVFSSFESLDSPGLTVTNGSLVQVGRLTGNGDIAPSAGDLAINPCVAYDTYLSLGEGAPGLVLNPAALGSNMPLQWRPAIRAIWTSPLPDISSFYVQDAFRFGDARYYLRVARLTGDSSTIIAGQLKINTTEEFVAEVPDWSIPAATALDLNFDGQVDSTDVAIVTRAYGTTNPAYDFDGDGTVDGDDLRPLLAAIQSGPGS